MALYHVIIDAEPVLVTFSPVEVTELICNRCLGEGALSIDVYKTEVK